MGPQSPALAIGGGGSCALCHPCDGRVGLTQGNPLGNPLSLWTTL